MSSNRIRWKSRAKPVTSAIVYQLLIGTASAHGEQLSVIVGGVLVAKGTGRAAGAEGPRMLEEAWLPRI
jgi:hypothetical protein